jgi:hypothetical protein
MRVQFSELEIQQQKDHPSVSSQMAFKQATNEGKKVRSVESHKEKAEQLKMLLSMYLLQAIPTQGWQVLSQRS